MGRAFEYRKAAKLKRWGHMAKTFTKIGKQIAIAVKAGGPEPDMNPALRACIANAKRENMPKDNIERAIKNAMGKDQSDYKEVTYEGYGPHGVAVFVETLTDNTTRTVGDVRSVFNKFNGNLGTQGSLSFLFDHKSVFQVVRHRNLAVFVLHFNRHAASPVRIPFCCELTHPGRPDMLTTPRRAGCRCDRPPARRRCPPGSRGSDSPFPRSRDR